MKPNAGEAVRPEFEEKSYETAFNIELALGQAGSALSFFAPGARLEAELQTDVIWNLAATNPAWAIIGLAYSRGAAIPSTKSGNVPSGMFNLFIQYKRSDALTNRAAKHWGHFGKQYYRFRFDHPSAQLSTLQRLESGCGSAAQVIYAAPHFHEIDELMAAISSGTVIRQSVIVKPSQLSTQHAAFNFLNGYPSIQNPEPEFTASVSGAEYFGGLEPLLDGRSFRETLAITQEVVSGIEGWRETWGAVRPVLFDYPEFEISALDAPVADIELLGQYAEVATFAYTQGLGWLIPGVA